MTKGIIVDRLSFTGPGKLAKSLKFGGKLTLIWGASNTGKSFSVEAIDFMLGAKDAPEPIAESAGYDSCWLELTLPELGEVTLSRSLSGGPFALYSGHGIDRGLSAPERILAAKHDAFAEGNLSALLLSEIGLRGKLIATNSYGQKRPLSFRDLARAYLGSETGILSSSSPIEGGQKTQATAERSVFRLLLTGVDDSSIISVDDPKKFNAGKSVRLELVDEMLSELAAEIGSDPTDALELNAQLALVETSINEVNKDSGVLQTSIRELLQEKQTLSRSIPSTASRLDEVMVHLDRFSQLQDIYRSDIARLESLEEAGFLLSLTSARDCPLCGAAPSSQHHASDHQEITLVQSAAVIEIDKIRTQAKELSGVTAALLQEKITLSKQFPILQQRLEKLEEEIALLLPQASSHQADMAGFILVRDQIKRSLGLLARREDLLERRARYEEATGGKKADRPVLAMATSVAHEFSLVVSDVLEKWGFPGMRHVSFDDRKFDLSIDGKRRSANGKGVRAVTHAAFKVALLLYCKERNLPHPGFVILDTPLLTYRDPLKKSKHGELTADEVELAKTSLKDRFFEHLGTLRDDAQIIVFENVDPPAALPRQTRVERFSANDGRRGLF
ncbi:hypothetical protein [Luteibacter sp.]|uniref:hypothetical protein n=1 Tax=Luteibacter sp. TaxID=1886636 RepID=UPI003F8186A5